jgi:hypothetical protein
MKKLILASFIAAFSMSAFAADAAGKWNGKIKMDLSSAKKMIQQKVASAPAAQKENANKQLAGMAQTEKMMSSAVLKLELKKDGTVSLVQTAGGKSNTETGKWTQTGNKIKMFGFSSKRGGPSEMNGVLSANGKTLAFDLSDDMNKQAAKNGAPAGMNMKLVLSFTKA